MLNAQERMRSILFLAFVFAEQLFRRLSGKEWNYETGTGGPADWLKVSPTCAGERQSPIDIPPIERAFKERYKDFTLNKTYHKVPKNITLSKSNHTVAIEVKFDGNERIILAGGPLTGKYFLENIHFHWGNENNYGSEHPINGVRTSMEMHVVFVNRKYLNFTTARTQRDGLVVIAYLLQAKPRGSPEMDIITGHLPSLQKKGDAQIPILKKFPVSRLAVPFQTQYVTYEGSLTTPPCSESVTWIVHYKQRNISYGQIKRFRDLYVSTPTLKNNFRPVQRLNKRRVCYQLFTPK